MGDIRNRRNTDPATSHEAARRLAAASLRRSLLIAYSLAGERGLTAEEATEVLGLDRGSGAWKRVSDLKRDKEIKVKVDDRGRTLTRMASTGRWQDVLVVTRMGSLILEEGP